jgi:GDP-L-fucose synthase
MNSNARIFVAGHNGLVGSALVRRLLSEGASQVLTRSRNELDLMEQVSVDAFFAAERPEYVIAAAAKVGGIQANNRYPAEFISENLIIQSNLIQAARRHGVRKFCFLGSSCIYPKFAPQPMREDYLLTGPLESTNEWYAIAKIAGIKTCQAFRKQYGFDAISVMPTNLYGPGDNFHLDNSHVLPAMIRRFHEAAARRDPEVTIWGSGTPRREFLYVDDLADAVVHLMRNYSSGDIVNIGTGEDISIIDLAHLIAAQTGYKGKISTNPDKPDGPPRKLLDVSRLRDLGWSATTSLTDGVRSTYEWYLNHEGSIRES